MTTYYKVVFDVSNSGRYISAITRFHTVSYRINRWARPPKHMQEAGYRGNRYDMGLKLRGESYGSTLGFEPSVRRFESCHP